MPVANEGQPLRLIRARHGRRTIIIFPIHRYFVLTSVADTWPIKQPGGDFLRKHIITATLPDSSGIVSIMFVVHYASMSPNPPDIRLTWARYNLKGRTGLSGREKQGVKHVDLDRRRQQ